MYVGPVNIFQIFGTACFDKKVKYSIHYISQYRDSYCLNASGDLAPPAKIDSMHFAIQGSTEILKSAFLN